jgi:hypothetical protein
MLLVEDGKITKQLFDTICMLRDDGPLQCYALDLLVRQGHLTEEEVGLYRLATVQL